MTDKQISDLQLGVAMSAYNRKRCILKLPYICDDECMKAALEAVFASMPDDKQVIKDFMDMMVNEYEHDPEMGDFGTSCVVRDICNSKEYQALKASISPVSEDKVPLLKLMHVEKPTGKFTAYYNDGSGASLFCRTDAGELVDAEWCVQDEDCLDNYSHWSPLPDDFEFFGQESVEQSTDTQDNDGWIKHDGKSRPCDKQAIVEVKFKDGKSFKDIANYWNWRWKNDHEDIIAYRIIDEPKEHICHDERFAAELAEEKKERAYNKPLVPDSIEGLWGEKEPRYPFTCKCESPCYFMNNTGLHCINCYKLEKEPKKQTLLECIKEVGSLDLEAAPRMVRVILAGYSQYLEQNKCK